MKSLWGSFRVVVMLAVIIVPIGVVFWKTGMLAMATQVFGVGLWIGVFVFIAFVLGGVYFAKRWFLGSLKPQVIANGLPATATVIRSYQGGMSMRYGASQFYSVTIEVNVTTDLGESWPAKIQQVLPVTQVGVFQPGMRFAVMYDPKDRSKVVMAQTSTSAGGTGTASTGFSTGYPSGAPAGQQVVIPFGSVEVPGYGTVSSITADEAIRHQPQEVVRQLQTASLRLKEMKLTGSGVEASATILRKKVLTEGFMNGADALRLEVRVSPGGMRPQEVTLVCLVQKPSIYKTEPGRTVYVIYDRNNPSNIVLTGLDRPNTAVEL